MFVNKGVWYYVSTVFVGVHTGHRKKEEDFNKRPPFSGRQVCNGL
jgi:hypothetical protein